jgi:hypothetical protein
MSTTREHIDSQWEAGNYTVIYQNQAFLFSAHGVDGMRLEQVELLDTEQPHVIDGRVVDKLPGRVREHLRQEGYSVVRNVR